MTPTVCLTCFDRLERRGQEWVHLDGGGNWPQPHSADPGQLVLSEKAKQILEADE